MTPEDLEKLVAQADLHALAQACESLTESERRKLSKFTAELSRELDKAQFSIDGNTNQRIVARLRRLKDWITGKKKPELHEQANAARLAMLAMCPLSLVKRVVVWAHYQKDADQAVLKVLSDRRPDWIDAWIEERLKAQWKQISWQTLRALMKRGLCKKPEIDEYIELMVDGLPGRWRERDDQVWKSLSKRITDEDDLLTHEIWRLFEIETGAFLNEKYYTQHAIPGYETWSQALKRLSQEGRIDRQRLIDASLSGLSTGFKRDTLSGYMQFHELLDPTLDEKVRRQQTYIDLLANQASHVVTFALRALKAIDQADQLDAAAFLDVVTSVLAIRTKTQPLQAIALIQRCAARRPELAPQAAAAVTEALIHESPDVQKQALKLLETLSDHIDESLQKILAERVKNLTAVCRPRGTELMKKVGATIREESLSSATSGLEDRQADLLTRAGKIPSHWRHLAGVDSAIEAMRNDTWPAPLSYDLLDVHLLTCAYPINPIATVDELIDAVAHAIEIVETADEVERILDGISRLCDQQPADFQLRTGPLLNRCMSSQGSQGSRGLLGFWGTPSNMIQILAAWLLQDATEPPIHKYDAHVGPRKAWNARLNELARRVAKKQAGPLLSAPTHAFGWIDPRQLVRRMLDLQAKRLDPPMLDMVQALLRLTPDHRQDALIEAGKIQHDYGRAVRWALGAKEGPTKKDRHMAAVWLAAGRSKCPKDPLKELEILGLDTNDPDGIHPASYQWRPYIAWEKAYNTTYYHSKIEIKTFPVFTHDLDQPEHPTVAIHQRQMTWTILNIHAPWLVQWLSMIWPINIESTLVAAIESMMLRIESDASSLDPNHAYLDALFLEDRPWSELAYLAVWIGFIGRDADARGTATDVLIEAIQDGRAHPQPLGDVLVKLASGEWLKLNRVRDALSEVARISPLHAFVVADVLERWLASVEKLPRDAHYALEHLLELKTQLQTPLRNDALGVLETLKGSSKTAKTARSLLKLEFDPPSAMCRQAILQQLEARIKRAERWAAATTR